MKKITQKKSIKIKQEVVWSSAKTSNARLIAVFIVSFIVYFVNVKSCGTIYH